MYIPTFWANPNSLRSNSQRETTTVLTTDFAGSSSHGWKRLSPHLSYLPRGYEVSSVDSADLLIVTQIVAYWHALCAWQLWRILTISTPTLVNTFSFQKFEPSTILQIKSARNSRNWRKLPRQNDPSKSSKTLQRSPPLSSCSQVHRSSSFKGRCLRTRPRSFPSTKSMVTSIWKFRLCLILCAVLRWRIKWQIFSSF